MIPMLDLKREYDHLRSDIDSAIARCLANQQWILGPDVRAFEEETAAYLGAAHAVGISSGTDALVLALRAFAIRRTGREFFDKNELILTTPFTFAATADAILRARATPVFVDIDPKTLNIDAAKLREYLEGLSPAERKNVVGIVPVHLFGLSAPMDEIVRLAREHGFFVLEDAAQSFGSSRGGKKLGTIGDAGAYSFFPSKNLGGFGDGGMAVSGDAELAGIVRMLLKHGGKDKYNVEHLGYNARLDTVQAAVLRAKLPHIDRLLLRRGAIAKTYDDTLAGLDGIALPDPGLDEKRTYNQYTIRVAGGKRDALARFLKDRGIDSQIYYPIPLHRMKLFASLALRGGDLSESEKACGEVLSLPIDPLMSAENVQSIVLALREFFQPNARAVQDHANLDITSGF